MFGIDDDIPPTRRLAFFTLDLQKLSRAVEPEAGHSQSASPISTA